MFGSSLVKRQTSAVSVRMPCGKGMRMVCSFFGILHSVKSKEICWLSFSSRDSDVDVLLR
uniref:Uncharacterized protein n=1 Tax=Anguilla anguilla TaxID=7936 RepID=A0A0E9T8N3_ANGAN